MSPSWEEVAGRLRVYARHINARDQLKQAELLVDMALETAKEFADEGSEDLGDEILPRAAAAIREAIEKCDAVISGVDDRIPRGYC